ncbi:MAG: Crp/Fnr family transcriptional regulator [Chloroflexota bacterium]|nr:Crp/Fnr family transcriptional regulator [Chloroflexota bacterium]
MPDEGEVFVRNRLLAALPTEQRARLLEKLEPVSLRLKEIVYDVNQPISHVYFPNTGVFSLLTIMQDGAAVEVGTVGYEGMVGLPVFLGADSTPSQAFSQIPGESLRMAADVFKAEVANDGPLQGLLNRYTQGLFNQLAQSAACNRLHTVDERLARWLLMTHDRVGQETFPLTHEFMAHMLGVRRATVTVVAGRLQQAGMIRYSRGRITVVDRPGLEAASCECYGITRAEFERLLGHGG